MSWIFPKFKPYKQHIDKNASERKLVNVGRISTVVLMLFSALLALVLTTLHLRRNKRRRREELFRESMNFFSNHGWVK